MSKRLTRRLMDVIDEVRIDLEANYGIGEEQLAAFRARVDANGHTFPEGSNMVDIAELCIDYEVQRDVIVKHIIGIMRSYDPRLCGPASSCRIVDYPDVDPNRVFTYDGQHRTVSTALLGYTSVPCNIVVTDDPAFPSYAFEQLNETGVKKLYPADLHRNALTRYRLGSREIRNVMARTLQDQFDWAQVDLEDKGTRKGANRGDCDYFFSHFKYAYKTIELDDTGTLTRNILDAIQTVFPLQEEIDQGVFIGLYELSRLDKRNELPESWMTDLLRAVKKIFNSSSTVHAKAKLQWAYVNPGATWSAPGAMSNFLRETYYYAGETTLELPYHGKGALMQLTNNPAPQLFPRQAA